MATCLVGRSSKRVGVYLSGNPHAERRARRVRGFLVKHCSRTRQLKTLRDANPLRPTRIDALPLDLSFLLPRHHCRRLLCKRMGFDTRVRQADQFARHTRGVRRISRYCEAFVSIVIEPLRDADAPIANQPFRD